jgi:hypothetical protein
MKKRVYRIFVAVSAAAVIAFPAPAQKTGTKNDEITLPDATTVVTGDAVTAGKDAVPDYETVLPGGKRAKTVLPELPAPEDSKTAGIGSEVRRAETEKNVYAEGLAGGGFPGYFTGLFSIYRTSGSDPFRVTFSHESVNGYARTPFTDGYFDRSTAVSARKTCTLKNTVLDFSGAYESSGDGLQKQYDGFYDVSRQSAGGKASAVWTLPHGFMMSAEAGGSGYMRYAGITGSPAAAGYAESASLFEIAPEVKAGWSGYGITADFSAAWYMEADTGGTLSDRVLNRGQFGTSLEWKNSAVRVYGNAAAVIGSSVGKYPVIVPFTAGTEASFPSPLSDRKIKLAASGGLYSGQIPFAVLERRYKFSALSFIPGETSDWYGMMSAEIPVKDILSFTADAEYRATAAGNGVWESSYSDSSFLYGQYVFGQTERQLLHTAAGVTFRWNIITVTGSWKSQWMYVPVLEAPNTIRIDASVQDKNSRWGAQAGISFFPDEDQDHVPDLEVSSFFRISPAVRLAVKADDIVKLISGSSRTYAGRYSTRSGTAGILVKFFF